MRRAVGFLLDRRGAAALEFALVGLPLLFLILGLIEFGRALYVKSAIIEAIDRAQRIVMIDPDTSSPALEGDIRSILDKLAAEKLTVGDRMETISGADYRLLSVDYDMTLFVPTPLGTSVTLGAARRVVQGD